MNELGKRLEKSLEEAKRILATQRKDKIERLELVSIEIRKGFDERIGRLYQKRNLIALAIQNKLGMKRWKVGVVRSVFEMKPLAIFKFALSIPFIYGIFIPAVIFHVAIELYHQVAFRLYGIPLVNSKDYFVFDRALLSYLNWLEKINCLYCSYVNCLISYSQEIGGRTERFWCPIKHAKRTKGSHSQYAKFFEYLDAEEFRKDKDSLRDFSRDHVEDQEDVEEILDTEEIIAKQ